MKKYMLFFTCLVIGVVGYAIMTRHNASASQYVSPLADTTLISRLKDQLTTQKDNFHMTTSTDSILSDTTFDPDIAFVAVDFGTGATILSHNAEQKRSIASLTKIMSAMVALDLAAPSEFIRVSKKASLQIPTKIGVVPGQKMTLDELLHAMLMTSANDATQAVADGIDNKYQQHIFVWAMNQKAKMLGLKNTHFTNPQGFDDLNNYSSPQDLAILSHYALTYYPEIAQIVSKDFVHIPTTQTHKQFDLYNWNGLLDVYPNVSGLKIGNTNNAKYTDIVVAQRNGHKIIVVMLGANDVLARDMNTATLLDSAFNKAFNLPPIALTTNQLEEKYLTWKYWN